MRPSNKEIYIAMIISIVIGAALFIIAVVLDIASRFHIFSIFTSLVISKLSPTIFFPIDPKNERLKNVDIGSAMILFVVMFGPIATIFISITSLLSMRGRRKPKNVSS